MTLWSRWVAVCSEREQGRPQAIFRIVIGAIFLVDAARILAGGEIVDPLYTLIADGGFATRESTQWLVSALGGHTPGVAHALYAACGLLASALCVGIGGRLTPFLLLQVQLALRSLPPDVSGAYDLVLAHALFLLFLGRADQTLSLACRIRTGRWTSDAPIWALPRYLMVLQITIIYVGAGLAKQGLGWFFPYDALHYSLQRASYLRVELDWIPQVLPITRIGSAVSIWWELTFGVMALWFAARRGWLGTRATKLFRWDLRWLYLGIGVAMHASLSVLMQLGPFSAATVAFYVAFFEPRELGGGATETSDPSTTP